MFYYINFEAIIITNLNNHYAKSGSLKRECTPIYVCRLLSKNLLRNLGYLVSYLTKHKKFITYNIFKYS